MLHRIAFPVVSEWCQTVSGIRALALPRFLALSPGPAILSKRGIPPFDRFKLLFGQPFAYFGFEVESGEEVRKLTMCSSHGVSKRRMCSSFPFSITIWGSGNSLLFTVDGV
jgi:hypothetical protein